MMKESEIKCLPGRIRRIVLNQRKEVKDLEWKINQYAAGWLFWLEYSLIQFRRSRRCVYGDDNGGIRDGPLTTNYAA